MAKAKKQLRAVGYCRTSGESQRDNTSIPRQRAEIERMCKANGWKLLRIYVDESRSGSKTEGRDEFQAMLRDAANGEFDVLVPFDATRLARDGVDVVSTAKVLRASFGVLTVDSKNQFDNRDHRNVLRNFVAAGVSEHERLSIMERMIGGKIARAQNDNIPTSGRLPFGRTFDRDKNEWGLDRAKADAIRAIADRYLAGESLRKLADEPDCPLSYAVLWRTLREHCGDTWTLNYRVADLDWTETVTHKVPRLLDGATIAAIKRRMEDRRTKDRGKSNVHDYPLRGRIFCGGCGRLMTGAARPNGTRVYRHAWNSGCTLTPKPNVRADKIEEAVIRDLFETLGNPAAIERAVKDAVPDSDKLVKRRDRIESELDKIDRGRERVLDKIARDIITDAQADKQLHQMKDRESGLRAELDQLTAQLGDMPDAATIRAYVEQLGDVIVVLDDAGNTIEGGNDVQSYLNMMQGKDRAKDVRRLIEAAFALPQRDGSPSGLYVFPVAGGTYRPKQFNYEIRGCFGESSRATKARSSGRRR